MPDDSLANLAAIVNPAEIAVAADRRLWLAMNPQHGKLPGAFPEALERLADQVLSTAHAVAAADAPDEARQQVVAALGLQASGMLVLAKAVRAKDPEESERLSRQAGGKLRSAARALDAAGLDS